MGLGGTAKKLQKVIDAAEQLYAKMNEVTGELRQLQSEVETTSEQVDRIEGDLARQRALVEAMADQQGIDVDEVLADVELPDERDAGTQSGGESGASIDVSDEK